MRYELKDLRLFKAIVDAQNLSAGAAAMHMTASSASYRLKNLEYAVGSSLFDRTPRGMKLTAAGEVLLRHTRKLMANVDIMHNELRDYSSHLKGSIRLLANSSALNGFIIPSLASFLVTNTTINIDLREQESLSIPGMIQAGDADIGVLAGSDPLRFDGLISELYAVDRLVCVVANDHPLSGQASVTLREMLSYDLVSVDRKSSNFAFLDAQIKHEGYAFNARVHVQDFNSVLYLVEAGVGLAVVPASVARNKVMEGRIQSLSIAEPWSVRHLYLVTQKEPVQKELVQEFARILLQDPAVVAARAVSGNVE
ncbi:MAG TPA: LysR family transcriptional regulator [Burkholderiaceae bacterium]|nr:LysR family transcriptional regulator [Burkholderiaceae bacterium]